MMLLSSLPLITLFAAVSANGPRPRTAMAALLGGYALVWTGFGALAFLGATATHHAVMGNMWLMAHPWLITGVLAMAGVLQFMPLKDRCLRQCRHPGAYLLARYRRGIRPAFLRLGAATGWFCVGCCWALMLVMFVAGVARPRRPAGGPGGRICPHRGCRAHMNAIHSVIPLH